MFHWHFYELIIYRVRTGNLSVQENQQKSQKRTARIHGGSVERNSEEQAERDTTEREIKSPTDPNDQF